MKLRHIFRVTQKFNGYLVKIRIQNKITDIQQTFPASKYGGVEKALDAAIKWRNKKWKLYGIAPTEKRSLPIIDRNMASAYTHRWRVRWIVDGKYKSKSFSELKYGKEEAEQLAKEFANQIFINYFKIDNR